MSGGHLNLRVEEHLRQPPYTAPQSHGGVGLWEFQSNCQNTLQWPWGKHVWWHIYLESFVDTGTATRTELFLFCCYSIGVWDIILEYASSRKFWLSFGAIQRPNHLWVFFYIMHKNFFLVKYFTLSTSRKKIITMISKCSLWTHKISFTITPKYYLEMNFYSLIDAKSINE